MKNSLLVGIVLVLVIVGVFWWGMKDKNASDVLNPENNATTTTAVGTNTSTGNTGTNVAGMKVSLGGIFAEAGNHQCDYERVSQSDRNSSVLYFSGGKMRGEFRTYAGEESMNTLMVYDGSYLYTWVEGKTVGTKTEPKTIKDLPALIPEDITSGRILGTSANNISWNCHAWNKDASKLLVPKAVKFN